MTEAATLLGWAEEAVGRPDFGPDGAWPRVTAFLCRQALEEALDAFWKAKQPGIEYASRATQTACLEPVMGDRELAFGVATAWSTLSRACHHHPYELAPTAPELRYWIARVRDLVARLG